MSLFYDDVLRLRDAGISVFPIPYGTKVPTMAWKPLQERLATDDELRAWFPCTTRMNIGIVTGRISNLVVLDADSRPAVNYLWARLPRTPWHTQTARGWHFYFDHPGSHVTNRGTTVPTTAGPLPIHVRGDGGYVLGHGSLHPSGASYHGTVRTPRPPLPTFDPSWLPRETREVKSSPRKLTSSGEVNSNQLLLRARRYLEAIPPPIIGQGSDTQTLKVACRLVRGLNLSPADAEDVLWEWCGNRPGWTRDWIAAKVANAATYGKEPIGGLR